MQLLKLLLIFMFLTCLNIASAAQPAQAAPTLEEMIGQMIMVGFRGTGESPRTADLVFLLQDIKQGKIGGVILFDQDYLTKELRNIKSRAQLTALTALLQADAPISLFIAIDQEGGPVRRLLPKHGAPETPSAADMGQGTSASTYMQGKKLGEYLANVGINLDFAPVLDVNVNPMSPTIGARGRAFSTDAGMVAEHAGQFAAGLNASGILYSFKHFPGHGSASGDSHEGFTDVSHTWREREIEPYKRLLKSDLPGMVMIGHMFNEQWDDELPASLSKNIINGMLRDTLNWQGVVITDDLQMNAICDNYPFEEAILLAINAGVDIILLGNNLRHDPMLGRTTFDTILTMANSGQISHERIAESYARIMRLKNFLPKD